MNTLYLGTQEHFCNECKRCTLNEFRWKSESPRGSQFCLPFFFIIRSSICNCKMGGRVAFKMAPIMPPGVFRKYGSSKICYTGKDRSTCDQGICFGVSEVRVPWSTWRSSILHHFWWGLWDNLNQANHIASHTGSQLLPPHKTKVQIGVHTE